MKQWLKNSSTYTLICGCCKCARILTPRVIDGMTFLYRGSILKRLNKHFEYFLEKETQSKKSILYKSISKIGIRLNRLAAGFKCFFKIQLDNSFIWKVIKETDRQCQKSPFFVSGLFLAGVFVSYTAAILWRGLSGTLHISLAGALFVISAMLIILKDNIKKVICESITYKAIAQIMPGE